ncbi:MAG: MFS transporter [Promethearchaeota archaeon]|nr:MAG: MFS transporter [Candidatus Lokiarchaeota archaeon]
MSEENRKSPELVIERVPWKSRIWVSAADGFVGVLQSLVGGGVLTYYFTENRGLNPYYASIVWIIFMIWNALNDPLYGYITDRTKSRLGRRIPYIRYGAPLLAISYILCWINWPGSHSQTLLFVELLVFLFFYDTFYTAVASAIYVMPFEMAISNKARGTILVWKIVFSLLGIIVPFIMPYLNPNQGYVNILGYQIFHITLGIVVGLITFFSTFFYKEKFSTQDQDQPSIWKALLYTFKNPAFWIFEVISFTVIYAQTGLMTGLQYYTAELTDKVNLIPAYIAIAVGILGGLILLILQNERWGVKICMMLVLGCFSLGCFIILFMGKTTILTAIGFFGIGIGVAGGYFTLQLQFGDVMDYDESKTGLRREGMYAGVNSLITKPAISIAQAVFLVIIKAFGYIENSPIPQSDRAEWGIIIGWMAIPAVLLLICFVTMIFYPLAGKKWMETKKELAAKRSDKEREYLEKHGFKYME